MWFYCNYCNRHKPIYEMSRNKKFDTGVACKCKKCVVANIKISSKRGRPKGTKLSAKTRDKIAKSKTGYKTPITTRDKISKSVLQYCRERRPTSHLMILQYKQYYDWIAKHKEALDKDDYIVPDWVIESKNKPEIACSQYIEMIAEEPWTPESLLLAKEEILSRGEGFNY